MKLLSSVLGLVMVVGLSLSASAQDDVDVSEDRDLLEVSFYGGAFIPGGGVTEFGDSLGAKSGWQIGLDVGYFLKPEWVIGINMTYAQLGIDTQDPANTQHHRLYNPMAYVTYYFWGESNMVPYIKGKAGLYNAKFSTAVTSGDGSNLRYRELSYDPALAVGGAIGLFYYTSDYSGLFAEVGYQTAFTKDVKKDFGGITYTFGETTSMIDLHAGIRVFFGSDE
jgi:hypothetical protein